jgi:transcriptional regulator with XRE-family HTH domain
MPKKSACKHVLVRLREVLGQSQKQFADTIKCNTKTIEKLESGERKISLALAQKISQLTGVNANYLFGTNPKEMPYNWHGGRYEKDFYERLRLGFGPSFPETPDLGFAVFCYKLLKLFTRFPETAEHWNKLFNKLWPDCLEWVFESALQLLPEKELQDRIHTMARMPVSEEQMLRILIATFERQLDDLLALQNTQKQSTKPRSAVRRKPQKKAPPLSPV